jgi:hypothetical protein
VWEDNILQIVGGHQGGIRANNVAGLDLRMTFPVSRHNGHAPSSSRGCSGRLVLCGVCDAKILYT